jgi:hypothetical protein
MSASVEKRWAVVYGGHVVGVHERKRDAQAQAERMNAIPPEELDDEDPPCEWSDEVDVVAVDLTADLAQLHATPMFTSRYAGFRKEFGVPVRITVGAPKYWKPSVQGQLEEVRELAPRERFFWQNPEPPVADQIPVYERRLATHVETIIAQLAAISRRHPGRPLVLLCYENVGRGEVCHRTWFADWIKRYGIRMSELQR